jgi:hypothetical protein
MTPSTAAPRGHARRLATLAAWLLLLGPVVIYLAGPSSRVLDRSLSVDRIDATGAPVGLLFSNGPAVSRQVPLWREGALRLSHADVLALRLVTDRTAPVITAATLTLGECRFILPASVTARDGGLLELNREAPCPDSPADTGTLDVAMTGPGVLKLAGWRVADDGAPDHQGLTMTPPESRSAGMLLLRGRVRQTTESPDVSRLAVLMWLWDDATGAVTLSLLTIVALTWGIGVWTMIGWTRDAAGRVRRAAVAAGSLALALGLMWTLVIPPLQGADDTDHLLSYGEVVGRADLPLALETLATRVHFERVRFHRDEHLTALDVGHPHTEAWTGDVHAERMDARSPVSAALWRIVAPVTTHPSPAITLLRLRLFNALVFAVAMAIAAALVTWAGPIGGPWLLVGAVVAPSVPSFAVMLSDWAFVVSWVVLASASVLMLAVSGRRIGIAGLMLGLSSALLLGTSVSALPVLAVVALLLLVHIATGPHQRQGWPFWAGLSLGALAIIPITGDLAQVGFQRYDAPFRPTFVALLDTVNGMVQGLLTRPWVMGLLLIGLALLDRTATAVRQRVRDSRTVDRGLQWLTVGLVGIACGQMIWSLLGPLPTLGQVGAPGLDTATTYTAAVMASVFTSARLAGFDDLTFTGVWGGFGWADTMLPDAIMALLVILFGLGLLAVALTPHAPLRRWALASLVASVLGVALVAIAASMMGRNVHGRYLLPVALPVAIITLSAAGHWLSTTPHAWPRAAAMLTLALMHGGALLWVAMRYYGPWL